MRAPLLPLLLLTLAATGCRDPLGLDTDDVRRAETRWEAAGVPSYVYTYREVCFCPMGAVRVTVEEGVVTTVEPLPEDGTAPGDPMPDGVTVEGLFDRIRASLDRDPHAARAAFHPDLGYPVDVFFDYQANAVDEEWGFQVSDFQAR